MNANKLFKGDREMKKIVLLIILVLSCSSIAFADVAFWAKISPEEASIKLNETAEYALTIAHEGAGDETFELFSQDIVWDVQTEKPLIIPPGKEGTSITFFIRPLYVSSGFYSTPLVVRQAGSSNSVKKIIRLQLLDPHADKQGYLPAIKGSLKIEKQVNPSEPVAMRLLLENQNIKNLTKVDIKVRSRLLNKDVATSIGPLEKKEISFNLVLEPRTPPQKDLVKISVFAYDRDKSYQFDVPLEEYEIIAYGLIDQRMSEEKSFLKTINRVFLENTGNIARKGSFTDKKSFFQSLFTRVSPDVKKEKGEYKWEVLLNVGEKQEILITTNYWPLFVSGVILLCLIVSYFLLRSPIIIKKKAKIVSTKEGGISELKVILAVRNRSPKLINNIRIIDLVPKLTEFVKYSEPGTLHPYKEPTLTKQGSLLHWKIDAVDPGGEILITYRIKNQLSILEGFTLPVAVAKFEIAAHLERSTKSNVVEIVF